MLIYKVINEKGDTVDTTVYTKMKKIVLTILAATLLAAVVLTLSFAALASTAYTEIRTVQDLKSISSGGNYKLMNDLTLTEAVTLPAFSGKFDGNGKTVSGIRAPLFEEVSGTVSNLTLTGEIDISGKTAIAALTNTLAANGVIDSCTVNVTLSGTRPSSAMVVGGIAAYARSNAVIKNSTNQGNITVIGAHDAENDNAMGGIVGRMDSGATVTDCVNLGTIYANGNGNTANFRGAVAGIVGNSNGTTYITNCLNAGDVKAASSKLCIAGILGRTETSDTACPVITNCVNKGTVEKTADLGERPAGIASYVRGGKITWCANLGKVTSNNAEASGIVGYYNGSGAVLNLEYNYNAGDVKSFAIMRVNGTGNLKPVSNFYLSGKSACNTSIGGTIACANQQDLVTKVTAVENALFATDFEGADSINNGYPIAVWQCTHACETVKDADKGEICSKCGKVIAAIDCDHTFGAWTVVDEATATENGEKIRTCSKCGAIDREIIPSTTSVTPVNGVYTVDSSAKLQWVFNGIMAGTVPSDCTVKLACDIDVKGTLTTMTATFTGTFDGNGKTLSGLSNTLFTQFNGIAKDLTLRGDIDYSASSYAFDVARKAASFAHSVKGASLTNVVSYVNVKTSRNDINAGGLVGYANAGNTFKNCVYNGTYTVNWTGDGAGIGGIVGWSNSSGGTTTFDGCTFGGTINVTAGASGKDAAIGGILGNLTNAKVVITNCISNGTITSSVTAGNDYVGGLVGINKNAGSVIESSVNRSALTAKSYAGGIIGGMADNTTVNAVANYGTVTASTKGAIGGTSGGKTFSIQNSADFTEGSTLKLCGTTANLMGSYTADKITDLKQEFTFDGVTYKRYNVGVAEKESGILVPLLHTSDKFTPYISIKDEGASHSIRFVILTRYLAVKSESVTVSINFKDGVGQVIKSKASTLAVTGSDFTLYSAVKADGEKYFAATDLALFGLVITDIPTGVWEKIELTITDTASGASYITPVVFDMSDMQFSPENMPDFSSLGTVSSATYNAGPGLMSDRNTTTNEDSLMKVISNTTAAKLASYVKVLESNGFRKVSANTLDGDTYYTYEKYGKLFYLYHNAKVGETRIIVDNSSDKLSALEVNYTPKTGETTEFYQYSINYDLANKIGYDPAVYTESGSINCGMCYIIKLADNSVIVIDGGHEKQSTQKSRAGLLKFLREITGTKEGEKVNIATWFFSHAHGDHVRLASDFINDYHDDINLMSVTYNIPSYQYMSSGYDGNTFNLKTSINTYFPDTLYHKLHTGEVMNMAGVKIEVVFTHEDAVTAQGTTEIGDFNSTSTVLKITIDGKTLMLLGDISGVAESAIVSMHSAAYLKADMVQVSHHGFNFLNQLYPLINAKIAIFPQSAFYMKDPANGQGNLQKYKQVMTYATEEYFAHKYTYKFTVVNGEVTAEALPRYDAQ